MRIEKLPFTTDISNEFPGARLIAGVPGDGVYEAEGAGSFYLILDDSRMVDRMIPGAENLVDSLVGVLVFDRAEDRARQRAILGR